jgi:hypothetical protein
MGIRRAMLLLRIVCVLYSHCVNVVIGLNGSVYLEEAAPQKIVISNLPICFIFNGVPI